MKTIYYRKYGIMFSAAFFLFIFLIFFSINTAFGEMLSVKGDGVNLRTGPGTKYAVKYTYGSGFPVEILKRNGDWLQVKDFEEDIGWLHKSVLIKSQQVIVKVNKNSETRVNIRKGPGSENKIVGKAHYGVVFKIIGRQSGWVHVQHESGLTGWISANLLWGT